jgi:uncharacterized membrane protein
LSVLFFLAILLSVVFRWATLFSVFFWLAILLTKKDRQENRKTKTTDNNMVKRKKHTIKWWSEKRQTIKWSNEKRHTRE